MNLLLLHNPHASGGRARRLLPAIRDALGDLGIRTEVLGSQGPGEGAGLFSATALGSFDGVVAVGGDGTLFELVNGLYQSGQEPRPPVGVIPVGTGNAFARDLGLAPGDWRAAVALLAAGRTRPFDVGLIETAHDRFHFVNITGAGFVVEAGQTALRLKPFGRSAYTLATLWRLMTLRSHPFRLEIDGHAVAEQLVFVEISNTRYTGTRFLIAPDAEPDDGLFDVTLLRALARWRLLLLFPKVFSGRHVSHPAVRILRGGHVRLLAPAGLPLMADGEFRGALPADIRCLPRDLDVFCA